MAPPSGTTATTAGPAPAPPFPLEWTGETPTEREERRLAEAAVLVRPPAGQPRVAPADTGPSTQEPEPAKVTARAAQAASHAAPPREGAPDAREAETAAPASHAAAPTAAPGTPPTRGVAPAQEPGASPRAASAAEGSKECARGVATAAPASRATASAGHAAASGTPRKRGEDPARATGASPAAAAAAAVGRESAKYRAHANPNHTNTSPPKPFPPKPFPPGRTWHVRPPAPERSPPGVTLPQMHRQREARRVIQEGGDGAQVELRASHGGAKRGTGGDEGSAQEHAQGAGQGTRGREQGRSSRGGQSAGSRWRDSGQGAGKGPGHGKGARGRGQGAQVQGAGRGTVGERAGQGVGDKGRDPRHGQGRGRGPKGKRKGATGPKGQAGRGMGARRGGRVEGRGAGAGRLPQPEVQPVRCIPPGIQQMRAHHTHHHHHHHQHLYNIDPDAGELIPPATSGPRHQPAPPAPRAERARMASAGGGGRGAASAPQAQGQQGEPAGGAEGARPWDRDWGTVPDPLGDQALPLVGGVCGWWSWANQGTTRGLRNRPSDAVLLRRDGGNREVPPGGMGSPGGPRAGPQVSDLGGVARQVADVAGLPGRGSGTPHHGCGHQQLAPPGLAQHPHPLALPPAQPAAATAPAPTQAAAQVTTQTADARRVGGGAGPPDPRPTNGTA